MPTPTAAPFKSLELARVKLIPVTVTNTAAGTDPIQLDCLDKTLPGIAPGQTWTISTDSPAQEIAEVISGKFGGISELAYKIVYDALLMAKLTAHARTKFDVVTIYDDPKLDFIVAITVPDCRLITPGETSPAANASAGEMTIKVQPAGGGLIKDCLQVETTSRN